MLPSFRAKLGSKLLDAFFTSKNLRPAEADVDEVDRGAPTEGGDAAEGDKGAAE